MPDGDNITEKNRQGECGGIGLGVWINETSPGDVKGDRSGQVECCSEVKGREGDSVGAHKVLGLPSD